MSDLDRHSFELNRYEFYAECKRLNLWAVRPWKQVAV